MRLGSVVTCFSWSPDHNVPAIEAQICIDISSKANQSLILARSPLISPKPTAIRAHCGGAEAAPRERRARALAGESARAHASWCLSFEAGLPVSRADSAIVVAASPTSEQSTPTNRGSRANAGEAPVAQDASGATAAVGAAHVVATKPLEQPPRSPYSPLRPRSLTLIASVPPSGAVSAMSHSTCAPIGGYVWRSSGSTESGLPSSGSGGTGQSSGSKPISQKLMAVCSRGRVHNLVLRPRLAPS